MEMLMSIVREFFMFNLWEAIVLCLFFVNIGNCNKIKFIYVIVLGIANGVLSLIFPLVQYQILSFLFMLIFLKLNNEEKNIVEIVKVVTSALIFILCVDMMYQLSLETFGLMIKDFNKVNSSIGFIFIKSIEIIIIKYGGNLMKKGFWIGNAQKPARPSK